MRVAVHIVEPVVFTRRSQSGSAPPPVAIKGLVEFELSKPTVVTSILVSLVGKWHTEWPGGLPPSYQELFEENSVVSTQDILLSDKLVYSLRPIPSNESQGSGTHTLTNTGLSEGHRAHASALSSRPRLANLASMIKEWARLSPDTGRSSPSATLQGIELHAGSYTCPFIFTLPYDAAPSMHLPRGKCTYHVKVQIHRRGIFSSTLSDTTSVTVVMLPEDLSVANDIEAIWDDRLLYALHIGDRNYSIGDRIPFQMTLVPLEKLAIHQVSVVLEQQVTYRARNENHEDQEVSRFPLLSIKQAHKVIPILPVLPDSPPESLSVLCQSEPENSNFLDNECIHQLQSLVGPWNLRYSIPLHNESGLHFTFDRHPRSVIEVEHNLHITLVVKALDGLTSNYASYTTPFYDIKLVFPVQILSSHCTPTWTKLPTYYDVPQPNSVDPYAYLLQGGRFGHLRDEAAGPSSSNISPSTNPHTNTRSSASIGSSLLRLAADWDVWSPQNSQQLPMKDGFRIPVTRDSNSNVENGEDLASAEHARRFAKLIGGREGVNGELPPKYEKEFHPSGLVQ